MEDYTASVHMVPINQLEHLIKKGHATNSQGVLDCMKRIPAKCKSAAHMILAMSAMNKKEYPSTEIDEYKAGEAVGSPVI